MTLEFAPCKLIEAMETRDVCPSNVRILAIKYFTPKVIFLIF
jgi:hypothetical protein